MKIERYCWSQNPVIHFIQSIPCFQKKTNRLGKSLASRQIHVNQEHPARPCFRIFCVESSNRIEGVTISANRLRPVVLGRSRPKDRSEEELAGYRIALDWIFTRKRSVWSKNEKKNTTMFCEDVHKDGMKVRTTFCQLYLLLPQSYDSWTPDLQEI